MGGLVKVYAVGIYVDPTLAKSALADWHGFSATDIASAKPLWDAFCSPKAPFTRTVRLIVVRDVAGTHFQNGFERAVLPRVKQASAGGNCRPAEVKRLAKKFCAFFAGVGKMKIGSEIRITVDGELVTLYVDGRTLGDVRCAQLAWAVLDMYVGDESVVPGLKDNVAIGLHEVLAS